MGMKRGYVQAAVAVGAMSALFVSLFAVVSPIRADGISITPNPTPTQTTDT